MLRPSRISLVIALLLALSVLWERPSGRGEEGESLAKGALFIAGARIFDGVEERLSPPCDLLILDGVIAWIAPAGAQAPPPGAKLLDAQGLSLMPGLCELAALLPLEGAYPGDRLPGASRRSARAQLRRGVTFCLGPGVGPNARKELGWAEDALRFPALKLGPPWLTAPWGWRPAASAFLDLPAVELDSDDAMRRALAEAVGAVLATVELPGQADAALPPERLAALGRLARERGLRLILHVRDPARALQALEAGPHALLGPIATGPAGPELAQAMLKAGCAYLPALSSLANPALGPELPAALRALEEAPTLGPRLRASLEDDFKGAQYRRELAISGLELKWARENAAALWKAGVTFGLASMAGMPGVPHGLGARSELEEWRRLGVPLPRALRLASSGSAALAGQARRGRVAPGFIADLLLLKGDPLSDPLALLRVRRVIRGGQPWSPLELSTP